LTSTWGYGRLAAGSPTSPQATIRRCYAAEEVKLDWPQQNSLITDEKRLKSCTISAWERWLDSNSFHAANGLSPRHSTYH